MNKTDFLRLLGTAYDFPDYYSENLDSAEEILADRKEDAGRDRLSLRPLFDALLAEADPEEREGVWALLRDHFGVA